MPDVIIEDRNEPEAEAPAAEAASVEAAAEAAVEIAKIEAERDVTLAEIAAETTEAVMEAEADQDEDEDEAIRQELEECRRNLETMQSDLASLREEHLSILSKLEALQPPPNQSEPLAEEKSEPTQESLEVVAPEPPAEPAAKPKRKLRLI